MPKKESQLLMLFPGNTLKSLVLEVLCDRGVANAKEISTDINAVLALPVTLQGVYRVLRNLTDENVVIKQGDVYTPSLVWLQKLNIASTLAKEKIRLRYNYHPLLQTLKKEQPIHKTFKTCNEFTHWFDQFSLFLVSSFALKPKITAYGIHRVTPYRDEYNMLLEEAQPDCKYYICGQTSWDKYSSSTRNTKHITTQLVNKFIPFREYIVLGDYIMEHTYDAYHQNALIDFADKMSSNIYDSEKINKFLEHPFQLHMKLYRNPKRAQDLHRELRSLSY